MIFGFNRCVCLLSIACLPVCICLYLFVCFFVSLFLLFFTTTLEAEQAYINFGGGGGASSLLNSCVLNLLSTCVTYGSVQSVVFSQLLSVQLSPKGIYRFDQNLACD